MQVKEGVFGQGQAGPLVVDAGELIDEHLGELHHLAINSCCKAGMPSGLSHLLKRWSSSIRSSVSCLGSGWPSASASPPVSRRRGGQMSFEGRRSALQMLGRRQGQMAVVSHEQRQPGEIGPILHQQGNRLNTCMNLFRRLCQGDGAISLCAFIAVIQGNLRHRVELRGNWSSFVSRRYLTTILEADSGFLVAASTGKRSFTVCAGTGWAIGGTCFLSGTTG